jgi:hypothetical protein
MLALVMGYQRERVRRVSSSETITKMATDAHRCLETCGVIVSTTYSGAVLSRDRFYRYRLWRSWGSGERIVAFIMLNPSTADENVDDPTIRKCIGFAKRWEFDRLDVVNLFAWRATKPKDLLSSPNAVGPDNEQHVTEVIYHAERVVLAWGSHAPLRNWISNEIVRPQWSVIRTLAKAGTFGRNLDGAPKHPLMLAYDTPFQPVRELERAWA